MDVPAIIGDHNLYSEFRLTTMFLRKALTFLETPWAAKGSYSYLRACWLMQQGVSLLADATMVGCYPADRGIAPISRITPNHRGIAPLKVGKCPRPQHMICLSLSLHIALNANYR
ncbi:hypothetical protein NPIL_361021 [Nephila pilipes]|uniref:Uncharacterized protein n=1 Tax=Nephila pilipes TaxID=299642 RepID=A0A8X6QUD1_NEPPI|nr:hypothetical protein NPIL_361021 [Nephila pilipes]